MDPRFTTIRVASDGVDLCCEECKSVIETFEIDKETQHVSVFAIVRSSLRHSCASVRAIVSAALEDQVKQEVKTEVKEESNAMEGD